jgi:hypothetical protein
MMASSGYVAEVDRILCVVCATRKDACPFEVIQGDGIAVANWEACIIPLILTCTHDIPPDLFFSIPLILRCVH